MRGVVLSLLVLTLASCAVAPGAPGATGCPEAACRVTVAEDPGSSAPDWVLWLYRVLVFPFGRSA